ncbi:hypothetical protein A0H81_06838 [Grifola frondosa]|uniref:Ubiquitin 3 binding protein But2 C-terminal domain-containing protein n=1 Tax=Grifola frondosa TaxID=5627 RepID=A0A1C7M8T0_GRIFR|nr:hypothetical protein A0H81_06838 [Grifola frondosa]
MCLVPSLRLLVHSQSYIEVTLQQEEHLALLDVHNSQDDLNNRGVEDSYLTPANLATFKTNNRRRILLWIITLLLIITVTDILSLLYVRHVFATVYSDSNTAELEFANPYIGLAELYKYGGINASRIDPILNRPRVVAQVFRDRPMELAPLGEHDWFDPSYGTITPNEKHLKVDQNTHTIAQFRAIDFGMEDCSLVFRLPATNARLEGSSPFIMKPSSVLDVFLLDGGSSPLDIKKLSWRTRPAHLKKIRTLVPRAGEEMVVTRFPCVWGSLHTFEVACTKGSDCLLDVWSSQNETWGIYMYQHQTV